MANEVTLSVRSQLNEIIKDFDNLNKRVRSVQNTLKSTGEDVAESFNQNAKETQGYLNRLQRMGSGVANKLKEDFKALISVEALRAYDKLSDQFRGSVREAATLNDTIRKLGTTFGISSDKFTKFQGTAIRGLGEIGLSSDALTKTMQGLVDTPVRGEQALLDYSQQAGQLASLTGQQGQEGAIAAGIARVIQARGGDVNDPQEIGKVTEDLRRAFNVTGMAPQQMLGTMERLFSAMPSDMRQGVSTRGLTNLAAAGQVAGPSSTQFLEEFLSMSDIQRRALEAQGFEGVMTDQGIDLDKFEKAAQDVLNRIGGDPRMAAKTLGLTDEAADGFVRLAENMDSVREAQRKLAEQTGNVNQQYNESLSLGEAFSKNINRIKSVFAEPLAGGLGAITGALGEAGETDAGAAAVVGGGGILAALLAGGGLKGIGGALGLGGLAKSQALEAVTGEEVQNVYVVNASEMGSAIGDAAGMLGGGKGMLGKAAGMAKGVGGVGLAGGAGYALGSLINDQVIERIKVKSDTGEEQNIAVAAIEKLDNLLGGLLSGVDPKMRAAAQKINVTVQSNDKRYKVQHDNRGAKQ